MGLGENLIGAIGVIAGAVEAEFVGSTAGQGANSVSSGICVSNVSHVQVMISVVVVRVTASELTQLVVVVHAAHSSSSSAARLAATRVGNIASLRLENHDSAA